MHTVKDKLPDFGSVKMSEQTEIIKKSNRPIRAFCQNTAISDFKRYGKESRKETFGLYMLNP